MTNFRTIAGIFGVLTILFAATTAYLYVNPSSSTTTQVSTSVQTSISTSTTTQTVSVTGSLTTGSTPSAYTVGIGYSSNSTIGYYLTNGTGFTLYEFKKDLPNNGTSTCYGQCAVSWPAFSVSSGSITAPPGINASGFGTITRKDGSKQVTYNGWPLYYFHTDVKSGDTKGQGLFKVWFAYPLPAQTGSTNSSLGGAYTVGVGYSSNSTIGYYLTNATGFTLYKFLADKPNNGTSACYGDCAKFWPAFYASNLTVAPGLNASQFGVITRINGTKQTTYNGWPLYYFAPDKKAGDTNGQGIQHVWFAYSLPASPGAASSAYTVGIGYNSTVGFHLTNGTGFTLYFFLKDKPNNGTSACYGQCAKFWPAFYASNLKLAPGINASSFAVISRTDGTKQLIYNGWPLYTFAPDKKAGDTNGQGALKMWYAYSLPKPSQLNATG